MIVSSQTKKKNVNTTFCSICAVVNPTCAPTTFSSNAADETSTLHCSKALGNDQNEVSFRECPGTRCRFSGVLPRNLKRLLVDEANSISS
jgi:hypothetical protein